MVGWGSAEANISSLQRAVSKEAGVHLRDTTDQSDQHNGLTSMPPQPDNHHTIVSWKSHKPQTLATHSLSHSHHVGGSSAFPEIEYLGSPCSCLAVLLS